MAIATPNADIGGYDHSFVDTPHDRFICKICLLPSRDPYLSVCCGHLFCKFCLENVKKAREKAATISYSNACPVCCNEEFVTFPNRQADREIKNSLVYCTNKEKGCEWQGGLNNINNHLENSLGCLFEEVKCSNDCGKMIQRCHLTCHVETECPCRKVKCQYCHDTGEHQFIEGQHKEECPKFPLPCPNKCEVGSVPHEGIKAHRKECPLEIIQCEYHSVGCEVRITRKDMEKHNDQSVKEHLELTTHKLATALKQISNLTTLIHSQLNPTANASTVDISSALKWSISLDAMASISKSGNELLAVFVQMSGFNKMKENSKKWYSDSFYTHDKGYKMCLNVNAAGCNKGKGTHLSVYLYLMKGPHDDELKWPLRGKFEVKLLNQICDSEHCSMTVTYNHNTGNDVAGRVIDSEKANKGWGKHQLILNEDLHKSTTTCQYLKDDRLFFQVT